MDKWTRCRHGGCRAARHDVVDRDWPARPAGRRAMDAARRPQHEGNAMTVLAEVVAQLAMRASPRRLHRALTGTPASW